MGVSVTVGLRLFDETGESNGGGLHLDPAFDRQARGPRGAGRAGLKTPVFQVMSGIRSGPSCTSERGHCGSSAHRDRGGQRRPGAPAAIEGNKQEHDKN